MFIRFVLVGGCGFVVDAGLTYLLVLLTVEPWLARVPAILLAMVLTWLANRHFTYEVKTARSFGEGIRYTLIAISMALVNYLIYLVLLGFGIEPVTAVTVATVCQTVISFHAYRYLVFMKPV